MRSAGALAIVALVCVVAPATANAHARLLLATPADGQVLRAAPRDVVLRFDDPVAVGPGNAAVDGAKRSILAGRPQAHGRTLTIPLKPQARRSDTIRSGVVSDDGHTVVGVLAFAVGSATPHVTLSAGGGGPRAVDLVARWLLLAGALVAAGATVFLLAVERRRRVIVLVAAGFAAAAVGAAIEWSRVPSGTRFGHAMIAAVAAAALGVIMAACALRLRAATTVLVVPALAVLAPPAYGGHALDAGVSRAQVGVDVLHLAAASVWIGGLVALVLVLPADAAAVRRFSRIALVAVLMLAVTGVLRALSELRSTGQLFSTGYGRALVVKTVFFVVLILLGYLARKRLLDQARALRRQAALELGLLACLVGAVAVLTSLAPGIARAVRPVAHAPGPPPGPPAGAVTVARELRRLAVAIAAEPTGPDLRVTTTVLGPQGDGVNGLDVTIGGAPTSNCGNGCYLGTTRRARALRVSVGPDALSFPLPAFPLREGTPLLREINGRYLSTRSMGFRERLASGPGQVVTSDWLLQAPASLSYRVSDGSAGVIIGGRRWDRQGTGRWVESPQPRVPQPAIPWPGTPTNVFELPSTRIAGRNVVRVSFLDPATPAWFTVAADARTKAVVRIDMVAAAHFMRDSYSGVTPRLEIRPPHN